MDEVKRWRLYISPQTHIRSVDSENWLFKEGVNDAYLLAYGRKKYDKAILAGAKKPRPANYYFDRKKTIKRYWDYKNALKIVANIERFVIPERGAWIKFYIPIPKSWTQKKRKAMPFEPHTQAPDIDNFLKAFADSLMKKDQLISDYRASKFWVDGKGFIEITLGELPPAIGYTKVFRRDDKIK